MNETTPPENTRPPMAIEEEANKLDAVNDMLTAAEEMKAVGGMMSAQDDPEIDGVKNHFTLINATVRFRTKMIEQGEEHAQFFSKADMVEFPANRLNQLQNVAAASAKNALPAELQEAFIATSVNFVSFIYLGHMTDADFWAGVADPNDVTEKEGNEQVTQPATVTPINRP